MKLGHISFDDIQRKANIANSHVEFDIAPINSNSIGIVEVKSGIFLLTQKSDHLEVVSERNEQTY